MAYTIRSRDLAGNANQSKIFDTDIRILTDGLAGVGVVSNCAVTAQGSPDMTVAIAAGTIRIADGTLVAVTSGNGTIGTADATNPRIDLISASNAGTKTVTAGTAAANPKPPDLPSGNVGLAMVYVAANDTAISSGEITDKRVVLPTPLTVSNVLSGNVTLTTLNTFYDGPSVTLSAGTWLLIASVHLYGNGEAANALDLLVGKLWDGTTVANSAETADGTQSGTPGYVPYSRYHINLSAIVVIASGTPTWKISVTNAIRNGGTILAATATGGSGNNASRLDAVRLF